YRLSSHLRETGQWPLRGEGEWRVGIRICRQNPETVGPRPWIPRLCSFQIRWATGSPLLCRCPARNLGFTEPSRPCARAASGHAAAAPPSAASNSRRPMVTVMRPSRARCVDGTIARRERAVCTFKEGRMLVASTSLVSFNCTTAAASFLRTPPSRPRASPVAVRERARYTAGGGGDGFGGLGGGGFGGFGGSM